MLIVPSFTAINLLLKSNQNDSDFTWLELVHTFPCTDDMTSVSSHFMPGPKNGEMWVFVIHYIFGGAIKLLFKIHLITLHTNDPSDHSAY